MLRMLEPTLYAIPDRYSRRVLLPSRSCASRWAEFRLSSGRHLARLSCPWLALSLALLLATPPRLRSFLVFAADGVEPTVKSEHLLSLLRQQPEVSG